MVIGNDSDITYRFDRGYFIVWSQHFGADAHLYSNRGEIDMRPSERHYINIRTNPIDKKSIVASWHIRYDLDGDEQLDDGVFASQELYP